MGDNVSKTTGRNAYQYLSNEVLGTLRVFPKVITFLILDYADLIAEETMQIFYQKYQINGNDKKWVLVEKGISDYDCKKIAFELKNTAILTDLILSNNTIGDSGAILISNAVKNNNTLTSLNLRKNQISSIGATAIARAISTNHRLRKINMNVEIKTLTLHSKKDVSYYGTMCNDLDVIIIAYFLPNNTKMTRLNLGINTICDCGAEAIAKSLLENTTLTKLNLGSNHITDNGAGAIENALRVNSTLTELLLWDNDLSEAMIHEIQILTNLHAPQLDLYIVDPEFYYGT